MEKNAHFEGKNGMFKKFVLKSKIKGASPRMLLDLGNVYSPSNLECIR